MPETSNSIVLLIAGQTAATFVDLSSKSQPLPQRGDKLTVRTIFDVEAGAESLLAALDRGEANEDSADSFVSAFVSVWQDMVEKSQAISRKTDPIEPIGQLPPEVLGNLDTFHADQPEGVPWTPNIEDFWYLAPLGAAAN